MRTRSENLMSMLKRIEEAGNDGPITVHEIVHLIGKVSFAPLLIVPAIALVSPLSGIPLFSSTMGMIIFLVSIQMLLRRNHLWLPQWILRLEAKRSLVRIAFEKVHPVAGWLDRRTQTRLIAITRQPFVIIPQTLCVVSGLFLPLLELVPFSSSLIGLSVALLGLGMFARDGVILVLAIVPYLLIGGLITKII
ncbi:exopolysaccharide biosynthesis protein [uncultured Sulfitobacter sp.]|uniref:exopolysaccharide biosynthesis protein n=1 Tax=uncultured Sulfitobacter sp. TaxID=191468 RepID=UPI002615AB90|nr:exopolysaccharide biosynthesis protein [uncultured Sulfitobacter sp.]